MSQTCSVKWCACLPVDGSEYCAAHKVNPKIRPTELEPDEELIDAPRDCEACDGGGDCPCCGGDGYLEIECKVIGCDQHHGLHDCDTCDGEGSCKDCGGEGKVSVKKSEAA